ncbi:hypothetical protein [Thermomonospora umbrina]|uniref:Uncharacterized protein n=1 Tax=Thermomonospora umbrina TaxID=111806 RepID=A0A3D9SXB1_9ACTN|nr:hypothetical protein [Thermomonospora umbrina]REF00600.1 hypothetical protein DFJ69_6155 [Thermomonospora umbrina]
MHEPSESRTPVAVIEPDPADGAAACLPQADAVAPPAALERLGDHLRGHGFDVSVDASLLIVTDRETERSVEVGVRRRPSDDDQWWFCWRGGLIWICEADQLMNAVVEVKKALRQIPTRM